MSTAFVPSNTRKNHPDWVADPVVDYTRSTARKYHRRGLKHAKTRGSGTIDRRTPESFSWKRRPGATTTVEINHKRSETRIQHENAKISRKINQLMGVRICPPPPLPAFVSPTAALRFGRKALKKPPAKPPGCAQTSPAPQDRSAADTTLALSTTMTSRMFDSLQRLPDSTFRRVASTSLTPSLSATLLLVGRGEDEPRVSRRAHSTEPVLPSHMQWMAGSESLEKRNARTRGHKLGAPSSSAPCLLSATSS